MSIFTPSNQVKLTNVAVVRLKKGGKRFELACYKNTVMAYRQNVEKDVDEVLQTDQIFANVSKGQLAKQEDIKRAFGDKTEDEIRDTILRKGELQVSDKERAQAQDSMFKEIATIVAEKCINKDTKTPFTVSIIEKAMKEHHFSVKPNRNAKQQALEVIREISDTLNIARAHMIVLCTLPGKAGKKAKEQIIPLMVKVNREEFVGDFEIEGVVEPGIFRKVQEVVQRESQGQGTVQVLSVDHIDDSED
eukprot:Clim_evm22s164 gene=Clim_evmTU22s164